MIRVRTACGVVAFLGALVMIGSASSKWLAGSDTCFAYAGKHFTWEQGQVAAILALSGSLESSPGAARYSITYEKIPKHAFGIVPVQVLAYNPRARRLMHAAEESPQTSTILPHVTPADIHAVARKGGDFADLVRQVKSR